MQQCMALFICKFMREEDLSMDFGAALKALKEGSKNRLEWKRAIFVSCGRKQH